MMRSVFAPLLSAFPPCLQAPFPASVTALDTHPSALSTGLKRYSQGDAGCSNRGASRPRQSRTGKIAQLKRGMTLRGPGSSVISRFGHSGGPPGHWHPPLWLGPVAQLGIRQPRTRSSIIITCIISPIGPGPREAWPVKVLWRGGSVNAWSPANQARCRAVHTRTGSRAAERGSRCAADARDVGPFHGRQATILAVLASRHGALEAGPHGMLRNQTDALIIQRLRVPDDGRPRCTGAMELLPCRAGGTDRRSGQWRDMYGMLFAASA